MIADPEGDELNQAWLSYTAHDFVVTGGRQRIVHDNARFVGDVGWRQNMQTFDAITVAANPLDSLTVDYGYLWQINRIFGDKSAQGRWDSNSHLLKAAYQLTPALTATGYSYLLDFDNARAASSSTFGVSLTGAQVLDAEQGAKLTYRLDYAFQSDYADQPVNYSADYYAIELGYAQKRLLGGIGFEVLGSDGGKAGFATPLATLHAFNGWADMFLGTPANGIRDLYAWAGGNLPANIGLRIAYHDFQSDSGRVDYGKEWDLQLTKAIDKHWSVLLKAADFSSESALSDVTRFWAQVEFRF